MDKKIKNTLIKLNALAERGIGGEKTNAKQMMKKLMSKYGISQEEIFENTKRDRAIKHPNEYKQLMIQVIAFVTKDRPIYISKVKNYLIVECTDFEFIEIQETFLFYKSKYKEELKIFNKAFIQKNKLYGEGLCDKKKNPTSKELEEDLKMRNIASGLSRHTMHKQIKSNN